MDATKVDVFVVGAGFAGLYALYKMRSLGYTVRVLEAGPDIGGTWYWNRYPGARCDIESLQYSYSFSEEIQQQWQWSELYAGQPEIRRYINFVADWLKLRPYISLNTRVTKATFDSVQNQWQLVTEAGDQLHARFCVMATGCLSIPIDPQLPGLEEFSGTVLRTTDWPEAGVDLSRQSVGLIGTGATGIQLTPVVAEQAGQFTVFQRTANFSIPAQNRPMNASYQREWKSAYPQKRLEASLQRNNAIMHHGKEPGEAMSEKALRTIFETRWQMGGLNFLYGVTDLVLNQRVNDAAARFICDKIAATVGNPETAKKLMPRAQVVGAKRLCVDTRYYESFNRPNVALVDLRQEPLESVTTTGVRTAKAHYKLETLILATGFDAMTGALNRIAITGLNGKTLNNHWADGAKTLLGLCVAGFPNLFLITGPGSPSVLSNMVTSIEQNVDWVANCLSYLARHGHRQIVATTQAEAQWSDHVREVGNRTLLPQSDTWYVGANVPGKPRVYLPYIGGVPQYLARCNEAAATGYQGFDLS